MVKENDVKMVDFRFMDFPGLMQHFAIPATTLDEDTFEDGIGFDGSSIRGWQAIHESDMLVIPDPSTALIDPFYKAKTLILQCDIADPITRERYSRCPRHIARKAENYMKSTGIADIAYFGPEAEFFIFDDIRFDQNETKTLAGIWLGIYERDGDKLTICDNAPDMTKPSPTSFGECSGASYVLIHFTR